MFPVSLIVEEGCALVMFAYQNTDNYGQGADRRAAADDERGRLTDRMEESAVMGHGYARRALSV